MRPTGFYAVLDGEEIHIHSHGRDYVRLPGAYGAVRHEMEELEDFLSVKTFARWRGGKVSVSAVSGGECGFFTHDAALAEREGLAGDTYNGWHGSAALSDLTDVTESVSSVHPRNR